MLDCSRLELAIPSGSPWALPPGPGAWRVVDGSVEVFLSDDAGRGFLGEVRAGGWVFGGPAGGVEVSLVSVDGAWLSRDDAGDWSTAAVEVLSGADGGGSEGAGLAEVAAALAALRAGQLAREAAQDAQLRTRLRDRTDTASTDPLIVALQQAAAALGVPVPVAPAAAAPEFADLPALARGMGLRATRTVLPTGWARDDRGPLILRARHGGGCRFARWTRRGYGLDPQAYEALAFRLHGPLAERDAGVPTMARAVLRAAAPELSVILLAGLGAALLGLVVPQVARWMFDEVAPTGEAGLILAAGFAMMAAALMVAVLGAARMLAFSRARGRDQMLLAAGLYDHVLRLPAKVFRAYSAGDLAQRLGGLEVVRGAVAQVLFAATTTAIFALIYLVQLFAFQPGMAAAALVLTLVQTAAVALSRGLQAKPLARAAERDGKLASLTYELLEGVAKLRSAAAEGRMLRRWRAAYADEREASAHVNRIEAHYTAFSAAWDVLSLTVVLLVAGLAVRGGLTPGAFIAFIAAFVVFQAAFTQLCDAVLSLWTVQPLARRIEPILRAEPEAAHRRADPGRLAGRIAVNGLSFAYDGARAPVIADLDFEVAPGEHLAIVGGSGSGKSTILRLLLGFEQPLTGLVTYDGQDLSGLDPTRVRGQIGVVLQTSQVFAGTIHENIRGASDAGLAECTEAAEAAGLAADLARFPMGLHTPITEGASTLSGGQRQRILIARALAGSPRILFFDEATSALDNITQALVSATLDRLHATRITIAHRLSTVRNADRIAVLENGRFVETGDYQTLMARNGAFSRLVRRQLLKD